MRGWVQFIALRRRSMRVMPEQYKTDCSCQSVSHSLRQYVSDMDTPNERLAQARRAAGYASAADAARALGVKEVSYTHHENGTRGLSRAAQRYAGFFRVSLDWLMTGSGEMTGGSSRVDFFGLVGAGSTVEPIGDTVAASLGHIEMPSGEHLGALKVRGESQYPRYMDGEIILYDRRPRSPGELRGRYAVVDCEDGRRVIKKIVKGRAPGSWNLWSHNAPEEEDVDILACYEVKGTLES